MIRTSTAVAPSGPASTGLRSTSAICGKSVTRSDSSRDQLGERVRVDRLGAADAVRASRAAPIPSSIERRLGVVGRREPERDVLEHLDQDAAETEGDDLAERLVGDRADDDLLHVTAGDQHLLHLDAGDRARRRRRPWRCATISSYAAAAASALSTPTTTPPASVLCRMSGETIFSTTGKPISAGERGGLVGSRGQPLTRGRDPVRVATRLPSGAVSEVRPSASAWSRTVWTAALS